jgi:hypothetical protein
MKLFASAMLMLALALFGTESHALGPPTSSFVPRTHKPHASLSHKHHPHQDGHNVREHGASHKGGHYVTPRTGDHHTHHIPPTKLTR